MDHYFWTRSLMPGQGWIVRRWVKRGTLHAVVEEQYEELTIREADDVEESDMTFLLQSLLVAPTAVRPTRSIEQ